MLLKVKLNTNLSWHGYTKKEEDKEEGDHATPGPLSSINVIFMAVIDFELIKILITMSSDITDSKGIPCTAVRLAEEGEINAVLDTSLDLAES